MSASTVRGKATKKSSKLSRVLHREEETLKPIKAKINPLKPTQTTSSRWLLHKT